MSEYSELDDGEVLRAGDCYRHKSIDLGFTKIGDNWIGVVVGENLLSYIFRRPVANACNHTIGYNTNTEKLVDKSDIDTSDELAMIDIDEFDYCRKCGVKNNMERQNETV